MICRDLPKPGPVGTQDWVSKQIMDRFHSQAVLWLNLLVIVAFDRFQLFFLQRDGGIIECRHEIYEMFLKRVVQCGLGATSQTQQSRRRQPRATSFDPGLRWCNCRFRRWIARLVAATLPDVQSLIFICNAIICNPLWQLRSTCIGRPTMRFLRNLAWTQAGPKSRPLRKC